MNDLGIVNIEVIEMKWKKVKIEIAKSRRLFRSIRRAKFLSFSNET